METSTYDSEHPTNFVVHFSVRHDTLTWEYISKFFNFEILDKHNCGDLRRVPNAVERNSRYEQTLIRFDISLGIIWQNEDGDLVTFLEKFTQSLPEENIRILTDQGAKLEASVGLFVPYGICHHFPSSLLLQLGKLGISLTIDCYSGPGGGIRALSTK